MRLFDYTLLSAENMKKTIRLFTPTLSTSLADQLNQKDNSNLITHRLKPKKKDQSQTQSISNADKSAISTNQLLSSISTKLNPRSISISSDRRWSGVSTQKIQIKVSCLDRLEVPRFHMLDKGYTLDFQELRRKAIRKQIKNIVFMSTCINKSKKTCGDSNCLLKQKWKNKLVLQLKDAKQAQILKNYIINTKQINPYDIQIDKDVPRSFPTDKSQPKGRLTLYHTSNQKKNLLQILRVVLKMLTICDNDVGYVQGMNLYTAVIVSHVKQIQLSFMFIREVMKYGNMRKMYIHNFKNMKQLCHNLLHRHVKILMADLYELFGEGSIGVQMFMPFYLSMFACVVDFNFMHCVVDEFMAKGFLFLDKLMLSMLCYLKPDFFDCDVGQLAIKLGSSYIRSCQMPWDQIINLTQTFQLN